ncbi:MAG: U32 family peptidase [Nanoarchaeota archaeon]|nr:U32 family peptidase [Nanoarchaeota archaeon]
MKLSVGCPGNKEKVFELLKEFNQLNNLSVNSGNYINEIFLALRPIESNNIFSPGKDPYADLDINGLQEVVMKAKESKIDVRILLNSPNIDHIFDEKKNRKSAEEYIRKLNNAGIDRITTASEFILNLVTEKFPHFSIAISSYLKVNTKERAREFADKGAARIILPNDLNADYSLIKEIRNSVNCEIELMANLGCLHNCPYHGVHGGYLDNQSRLPEKERDNIDPYKLDCLPKMQKYPDKITFIRPSEIKKFDDLGINYLKIVGRQLPVDWILKSTKAYLEMKYDGNLAEILTPTYAIADKIFL